MNEYTIGWIFTGSMAGMLIASTLYWLGGRNNKATRRIGSAAVLATTVNIASWLMKVWTSWALLIFPLLFGGFSQGYGAKTVKAKIIRRTVYAVGILLSGLIFCLKYGGNCWMVFIPHVGVGLWSIWLGVKNPVYAPAEEGYICVLLNMGLIMYPFTTGIGG